MARGAVALERLAEDTNGDLVYTFIKPWLTDNRASHSRRWNSGEAGRARAPAARPAGALCGVFGAAQSVARGDYPDAAPTGGGRGGGEAWYTFLELGQTPGARVCARYGHLSLVPLWLAPYYCRHYPGVGHHAHPASLQSWPPSHLLVPLPVLAKKRSIGLPKPTTSRVASEATCVQRKGVSPLCTFALP